MALPVDIQAVLKAVTDTKEEADAPIALSVYLDDTADAAYIAQVRGAFASPLGTNARVSLSYMDEERELAPRAKDDMAVIVAGQSRSVGALAAAIRAVEVPVMVATGSPVEVGALARETGFPIPDGDIVSPLPAPRARMRKPAQPQPQLDQAEPIELDEQARDALSERMGRWIIAACPEKKLAFAHAFRFVSRPLAKEAISATALQNAGVGLLPIIPGADMPIMTLNQAKMLMQIASAYDQPLDKERLPELAALIGNAFLCRSVARSLVKAVPVAGLVISGGIGFVATEAVGRAAIEYFEAGGSAAGVANLAKSAAGEAADLVQKASATKAGKAVIGTAKKGAASAFRMLRGRASGR